MSEMRKPASNWKKLGDSGAAKFAAVTGILIASWFAYESRDQAAPLTDWRAESPPQLMRSLEGVQLGQQLPQLVSTHGPFDREKAQAHVVKKYADEEDYRQRNGQIRVGVRNGVVTAISYECREGYDSTSLNNVACHAFEDRIRNTFGARLRVLCAKVRPDDPDKDLAPHVRAYDIVEFGTRYIVIKDKVIGFIVVDKKELETMVGFNWVECA